MRVNANPFSPEYDRPGFSRVEIFTKPGSETLRGQAFAQFNDRFLNSRNPLLAEAGAVPHAILWTESRRPAAPEQSFVHAGMSSIARIDENGVVLATMLDPT